MLTDYTVIFRWSFASAHVRPDILTDSLSHLQSWMRDSDVLEGLHAEARTWVSAEVERSPGILNRIGEFYSREWLSEDSTTFIPARFCFDVVEAIVLMDESYSRSRATTHWEENSLDERILSAAAWTNVKETPYYHKRLGEAGFTGSGNEMQSTATSQREDNGTGDATTKES
ncbi:hypothetical protein ACJ41O_015087 [Fusarium nematophilum]